MDKDAKINQLEQRISDLEREVQSLRFLPTARPDVYTTIETI